MAVDGQPDVFYDNDAGSFSDTTLAVGATHQGNDMGVAVADFDDDDDLDLYATNITNAGLMFGTTQGNVFYVNEPAPNGNPVFTDEAASRGVVDTYLGGGAVLATLDDLPALAVPGSRLILNYGARVPLTHEQAQLAEFLRMTLEARGEPLAQKSWKPEEFEQLLCTRGFAVLEHATEQDLIAHYFASRSDGFGPGLPLRAITAERRTPATGPQG